MSKPMSAIVSWTQVANAKGYKVFWGTASRSYSNVQDVGSQLNFRVKGLRRGKNYYFAGQSYNDKVTSPYSTEVIYTP